MANFSDTFDRADNATVGNGWTEETDTVFSILSNKLRAIASGTFFYSNQLLRPSEEIFRDGTISVEFKFITSTSGTPQIHGRCSGTDDNTFYLAYFYGTTFYLAKSISGSLTTLASTASITPNTTNSYRMTLGMIGNDIYAQFDNLSTPTRVTVITATDTSISVAGRQAISNSNTGDPVDYDNFSAIPILPITFSDAFDRADSATVGNNWTEENAGIVKILNNKLRFSPLTTNEFRDNQLLRPSEEIFRDGVISVDFVFTTSISDCAPQLQGRCSGYNYNNFYICFYSGGLFYLEKYINNSLNLLGSASVTVNTTDTYRLTLTMVGDFISAKIENLTTLTILSTLTKIDADIYCAGRQAISLGVSVAGRIIDYDNFQSSSYVYQIFMDRFDGNLNAWTLNTAGGGIDIQTVDNDEKLILNDTNTGASVSAIHNFVEPFSGYYIVEADMYCASGAVVWCELLDGSNNVLLSVKSDGNTNQGTFDTDNDTSTTFTWTAVNYKNIVLLVDLDNNLVSCWYTQGDGQTPSVWVPVSSAKSYSGTIAKKIRFITDWTDTGSTIIDEVKIYKPSIFCLGDSNTAGYPLWNPNPSGTERVGSGEDELHDYTYRLGQKYFPVQWVANRGVGGDTTTDILARVSSSVIDMRATHCVLLIGTNDITGGVVLSTIESNISSIISYLVSANIEITLCSVPPCNTWNTTQNTKRNDLNTWIENQSITGGHKFADIYIAVSDPSNVNNILPMYDSGDGLHFTVSGLEKIAQTIYDSYVHSSIPNIHICELFTKYYIGDMKFNISGNTFMMFNNGMVDLSTGVVKYVLKDNVMVLVE